MDGASPRDNASDAVGRHGDISEEDSSMYREVVDTLLTGQNGSLSGLQVTRPHCKTFQSIYEESEDLL